MSTLKSSAEHLTLNADGSGNDIKFQSNATEVAAIDQSGNLTLSGTVDGVDIQTLNTAVAANTAKTGITSGQASAITANTAKVTNSTSASDLTSGTLPSARLGTIAGFTSTGIDDNATSTAITIDTNENVGVGTTTPVVSLNVNGTDAIRIPVGTTAQRPSTPAVGYLRLNTTSNATEIFKNGSWSTFAVAGMVTSGLRLHWDITNSSSYSGSGTSVTDLSGNGYTGTIVGNPTYSTNSGGYLVFDGNGDRITSTMTAPSGARAYGMWVYYTSTTQNNGQGYQMSGIQAGGGYTYQGIVDGGNVYFYIGSGTGGTVSPVFTLSAGNWYYQVLTFDGTNYTVYVNGASIQTGTTTTGTTSTTFSAGAMNSNYHSYGYGAEWQFYDKGLTAAEVLQNFNAGKGRYGL